MEIEEEIYNIIQGVIKDVIWVHEENAKNENTILKMWTRGTEEGKPMKLKKNLTMMNKMKEKQAQSAIANIYANNENKTNNKKKQVMMIQFLQELK